MGNQTSISLSDPAAESFRRLKEKADYKTNSELLKALLGQNLDEDVQLGDTVEVELSEEVEEKRALVVGVLEAADEMGLKSDLVDLISELRTQEMVPMCREITEHVLEKAKSGQSLNEADKRLLRLVEEIETNRDYGTPAGQIADGLFGDSETETTGRTATVRRTDSESVPPVSDTDVSEASPVEDNSDPSANNN